MSRAFLKNETADDPVVIPPRAPLPPGTPNYVTPRGLALLRRELTELEADRVRVQTDVADENERSRQLAELNGRIGLLNGRIASARVIEPATTLAGEVRFGATVSLRPVRGPERQLTIVGVDEADAAQGRVAFTAPIARALQGKRVGDTVALRPNDPLTITAIHYTATT